MRNCIFRFLEWLWRLCLSTLRHQPTPRASPFLVHRSVSVRRPWCKSLVEADSHYLRGQGIPPIRSSLIADGERRRRQARRLALWLAVRGIEVGPRRIHGVKVATR